MLLKSIVNRCGFDIRLTLLDSFSSPCFSSTDLLTSYHCLVNHLLFFFIVLVRLLVASLRSRTVYIHLSSSSSSILHHPSASILVVESNTISLLASSYVTIPSFNLLALRSSAHVAPSLSHVHPRTNRSLFSLAES